MGRLFGTDGVRGVANRELTAELALALGAAAARRLSRSGAPGRRVAVLGRDPRASGDPGHHRVRRVVAGAVRAGSAVVAVEPRARWERLYHLVNHVLEHHGDRADPTDDSGTDLFGLAQSLADRIHGMISIEDAQSHVLAYSASNDEATSCVGCPSWAAPARPSICSG